MSEKGKNREIPGFYFDEEKNKYFRITKDHPAPAKKTKKDEIRKDVKKIKDPLVSSLTVLRNREVHGTHTNIVRKMMRKASIYDLQLRTQNYCQLNLDESNLTNSVYIRRIIPNARQDFFAVLSKIKGSDRSILQIYDYHFTKEGSFEIKFGYDLALGQISDVIFAPFEHDVTNKLVISSLNERLGLYQAVKFWVGDFLVNDGVIKIHKNQTIWSSCFIKNSSIDTRIAIGLSTGILMVGPQRRSNNHPFVKTSRSDVLALTSSSTVPTLYSGSRDGFVRSCDLRSLAVVNSTKAKRSVDDLKILQNDIHLLVSTMAGHLELWDVRTWKPVLSYSGHNNTHSLLSIHVDYHEDFMAAVGEDCIARIWDIRTASCLRELPSFRRDEMGDRVKPSVVFLDCYTRSNISSGFLYGIHDELYYYSL